MAYVATKTLVRARSMRRNLTRAEGILWSRLRQTGHGLKFRRQHPIGSYIADFACVSVALVVEVDGDTHVTESERAYDARRDKFMRVQGWQVVRVTNNDVYRSLEGVMEFVVETGKARERVLRDGR